MSREMTNKILAAVDEGLLNKDDVLLCCLNALSEDEVKAMAEANDFFQESDEEE
jgi:hypothetical protein